MKSLLITTFFGIILSSVQVSAEPLGRGASCESSRKVSPKFQSQSGTCDSSKGLSCVDSENPEFVRGQESKRICDCAEEYYFDPVSGECRIQVGLACDPAMTNNKSATWSDKCPENAFCSTDVGRYGPRNAKGMCRCREGYYVNSVWFVGGGGTVCEKEDEDEGNHNVSLKQYYRKDPMDADYDELEMNGLVLEQ